MSEVTIKVLIAEDHQIMIDGIRSLLADENSIQIVAAANNGREALDKLAENPVDVVIADVNMPEMSGIELTRAIAAKYPQIRVLVLTMYNDQEIITEILNAGAAGYILKNTGQEEFVDAIRTVAGGGSYFSDEVTHTMLQSFQAKAKEPETEEDNRPPLTKREKEIVRLIAQENSSAEIAEKLFISQRTVETHRKHIIKKVGIKNVAGLVKYAIEQKLLD